MLSKLLLLVLSLGFVFYFFRLIAWFKRLFNTPSSTDDQAPSDQQVDMQECSVCDAFVSPPGCARTDCPLRG